MEYIGSEIAYKRGRGTKSLIPIKKNIDVKDDDIKDIVGTLPNSAPILFLFFTKQGKFDTVIVGGGKHEVSLQTYDVALSAMACISCFFVFSIGYGRQFSQLLGFFQQDFWGVPYTEGQKASGFVEYIKKLDQALEKI